MGERSEERKEQYKRVRNEFEDLQIEDKALFLLEAMVSTVARGVEQAGKGFADEIDKAFRRASRPMEEEREEGTTAGPTAGPTDTGAGDASAPAANVSPEKKTKTPKSSDDAGPTTT